MKYLVIFFLILMLPVSFAQPFGPPIYIGNPETGECKYYFAGDPDHFNPRDENFPDNIGFTTDFESEEEACSIYSCFIGGGRWDRENAVCVCGDGSAKGEDKCSVSWEDVDSSKTEEQNSEEEKSFITSSAIKLDFEGFNLERGFILFVLIVLIAHMIYSRRQFRRVKRLVRKYGFEKLEKEKSRD